MEAIKKYLGIILAPLILALKPIIKQKVEDEVIKKLEKLVLDSPNEYDNAFVLPLIAKARELLAAW